MPVAHYWVGEGPLCGTTPRGGQCNLEYAADDQGQIGLREGVTCKRCLSLMARPDSGAMKAKADAVQQAVQAYVAEHATPSRVPPNKGKTYPPEPLTPGEVSAIIGQCSRRAPTGIRNRAMLWLAYRSGLRVSELLALKPADLDMAEHSARVLRGKGRKSTVRYWHPSADDALLRWLDERKRLGLSHNGVKLFCTLEGGPVSDDYVRNLLRRLGTKAGVEKRVHPHGLRHSYAVELRKAGMDVAAISKLLGHSSIAVTARYLDHLTNDVAGKQLVAIDLPEIDA